jgi:hypothetical protein
MLTYADVYLQTPVTYTLRIVRFSLIKKNGKKKSKLQSHWSCDEPETAVLSVDIAVFLVCTSYDIHKCDPV